MLYDEKFEEELTKYHDDIYGIDTNDTNEIIFPFNDKYECEFCLSDETIIKNISFEFEMPNMNEFMDENSHKLLDGTINIETYRFFGFFSFDIGDLLIYNIHKYKRGYDIINNKLRISIFSINKSLAGCNKLKFLTNNLTFANYKNISVIISINTNNIKIKKNIRDFFDNFFGKLVSRKMHYIPNMYYTFNCIDALRYIYIITTYTESEIDLIRSVSLSGINKSNELEYNDLHKIYISQNISIVAIDLLDFDMDIKLICVNMNGKSQNIKFKVVYIADEQ